VVACTCTDEININLEVSTEQQFHHNWGQNQGQELGHTIFSTMCVYSKKQSGCII